ncbi:MAG: molecular chaperone DnaK [Anaerolineae bacterium]|nr:molecular chaperone DnaK [Anaerolineae bacterium]
MGRAVGIDLGTTNSAVAVAEGGHVTVITTSEGKRLPSVVAFNHGGERLTGRQAREQAAANAENTIFAVKRLLGRAYDDPEIKRQHPQFACRLRPGPRGDVRIHVPATGKIVSPQEIAAQLLSRLRHEAEAYLGDVVHDAVISVPAYFGEPQRQAVKDAATIAGLRVEQIINEPTAVALNYGFAQQHAETIMVVDLGGGTYDVSILDVQDGAIAVRASSGDTRLGGTDWDSVIVSWLAGSFLRQEAIDVRRDRQAMQRLREAAEEAKIVLSTEDETEISLPFLASSSDGPRHLRRRLTQKQFETLAEPLVARLALPVRRVLTDAGLDARSLDAVILVGGSTPMPMVRRAIEEVTGVTPQTPPQPDQAVVRGAALQAAALAGEIAAVRVHEVTPLSLGLKTAGSMMSVVVPRNTPIPVRRSQVFSTSEDDQTTVEIHVLQGERPMAADNETLGVFRLEDIPAAPRGIPQIEVTFTIDENGLLHVGARELISGTGQTVTLATTTSLSAAEVAQMVREAERCAALDIRQRNLVEARTAARQLLYRVERLDPADASVANGALQRHIERLREAIQGKDAATIRRLAAEVQQASSAAAPEILH